MCQSSAETRHLRVFSASRNAGFAAASFFLSSLFLAEDASFAHDGINPQRTSDSSRTGSLGFWRTTGIGWIGETLKRGDQSGSSETQSKYSSTICFLRDNRYRPHIGRLWQIGERDDYGGDERQSYLPNNDN